MEISFDQPRYRRLYARCHKADMQADTVPSHRDVLHDLMVADHPVLSRPDSDVMRYVRNAVNRPDTYVHLPALPEITDTEPACTRNKERLLEELRECMMGGSVFSTRQRNALVRLLGGDDVYVRNRNFARTTRMLRGALQKAGRL